MVRNKLRVVLFKQQTADETTSQPVDVSGSSNIVFYLIGEGTISAGAVTYEEATTDPSHSEQPYGGTWSIIGSAVNTNDVDGGKVKATHAVGAYHLVRARISTAVEGAGGLVSVVLVASV